MANRFFVGDIDNTWNDNGNWSATSGGSGGAGIPGGTDRAFFDANSPDCTLDVSPSVGSLNFTGYVNTITGTGFFMDIFSGTITTVLSSSTTYVDFSLRAILTSVSVITIDFNNAIIKDLILFNNSASNRTVTFTSSKINLTGQLKIETTSTGNMTGDFSTNNPDIALPDMLGVTGASGSPILNMGSGTWFYTGNSVDFSTFAGLDAGTSTFQIDMNDANFTWDDTTQTLHSVIINFNHTTNRNFTGISGSTLTLTGAFEVHILNTATLTFFTITSFVCPNGFISEEASSGVFATDNGNILAVTCRAGTGTNEIDLRGTSNITRINTLNIGDASYLIRPADLLSFDLNLFSTLLTTTERTLTFSGDSVVLNDWTITFADNASCDPLSLKFINCAYAPTTGAIQKILTKNAATDFDVDMGTQNWTFTLTNAGPNGHGTFLDDVAELIGTTGITTFLVEATDITDLDLRTELNDVIIKGGTGTRTITFESTRSPKINGSLTFEITSTGAVTFDYNPNQIFEVTGNFEIKVNGGSGSYILNMGPNTWKFGGNVTINTSAQITVNSETADVELNGTAAQTVTLDNIQMNTVTISNASTAGITFEDATKFAEISANAASNNINLNFKESLTHVIDTLTLTGTGSKRVRLRSKVAGTQWKLTTSSSQTVDHVDVKDSDASTSGSKINASSTTSIDSGNNIFWNFFFINNSQTIIVYDYSGNINRANRIVYDYSALITNRNKAVVYDYSGFALNKNRLVLYDYLKFIPDNVRLNISPYAQDSVRLNWAGFVPPENYVGEFFYGVYIDGEPYVTDIDSGQTWLDVDGIVNLEDIQIEVVIQTFFGQKFTFDLASVGDRIKLLFKESGDPNVHRYVFYGDDGTGTVNFDKEIGEIIVQDRLDKINTDFVPEGT